MKYEMSCFKGVKPTSVCMIFSACTVTVRVITHICFLRQSYDVMIELCMKVAVTHDNGEGHNVFMSLLGKATM